MHTNPLWRCLCPGLALFCVLVVAPGITFATTPDAAAESALLLAPNATTAANTAPNVIPGLAADLGTELGTELARDEAAARHAVLQATWPADIARLAGAYLRHHGQYGWAAQAAVLQQRALLAAALLRRNDVPLFRPAFVELAVGDGGALADVRLAALGDAAAACRQADRAVLPLAAAANPHRRIAWLHYAAALGSEQAAYALALHYRVSAQPLLAAQFEARAAALGHAMPVALGHARK